MLMAGALPAEPEGLLALGALPGQKDTTWTKLFVGGLPYHTTDKSLREHFAVYGDIEEAVVITDRQTSKSRGYGFVIMGDRAAAERACKDPNPIIDGRKANVNLAILGAKPRGNLAPEVLQETRSFLRVLIIIYGQQLASRGWLSEAVRPANDAVIYKTRVASRFVFGWLFILSKYTQFWERLRRLSRDTNAGDSPKPHIF
ncbi:unnamed protein product [Euphydryas editha]|uniref:RRM domain-containing protein n=1 Tax=Euphydryas editha TaxID=104508 RepID=A0AAU9UTW5_EUPED|nr:unnamed protein product [Euphydryas editha]